MTTKKIPMRKCLGCGEMFPKKELVRVVRTKTGEENGHEVYTVSLDKTGKAAGRGAYICKKVRCLEIAAKLISNASDISPADFVPLLSIFSISLRVGSDKAFKVFCIPIS
jgi:predicted RNA-binding protein YlxR (DUF448 family)